MFSTWYKNLFGHLYIYKYMGVVYSIISFLNYRLLNYRWLRAPAVCQCLR